jgi:hypothetical protein
LFKLHLLRQSEGGCVPALTEGAFPSGRRLAFGLPPHSVRLLTPYSDSYGSIFYTMTTFRAAHAIVGLLILIYTLILPRYSPAFAVAVQAVSRGFALLGLCRYRLAFCGELSLIDAESPDSRAPELRAD